MSAWRRFTWSTGVDNAGSYNESTTRQHWPAERNILLLKVQARLGLTVRARLGFYAAKALQNRTCICRKALARSQPRLS